MFSLSSMYDYFYRFTSPRKLKVFEEECIRYIAKSEALCEKVHQLYSRNKEMAQQINTKKEQIATLNERLASAKERYQVRLKRMEN
jgi:predicted RNase H-like nuclease (RuvC/YqgF family)